MVIMQQSDSTWLCKNSWGEEFGDRGRIKVSKAIFDASAKYYHVFWYETDLSEHEKQVFFEKTR